MAGANDYKKDLDALAAVLRAVGPLDPSGQQFVIRTAIARLGISGIAELGSAQGVSGVGAGGSPQPIGVPSVGVAHRPRDAKAFLKERKPINEVQRIAVLAYYLDHFDNIHEFKSQDLVTLNENAGGVRIGNPSRALDNATRRSNYLVSVKGGKKRISAHGEEVVEALPDQAKVDQIEAALPVSTRRTKKKSKTQ